MAVKVVVHGAREAEAGGAHYPEACAAVVDRVSGRCSREEEGSGCAIRQVRPRLQI